MTYNRKISILAGICGGLAVVYLLGAIFSGDNRRARSEAYNWLDTKWVSQIDKITMTSPEETIVLVQKNNQWFVLNDGIEYPARQLRVTDFIGLFTKRDAYPVRSSNAASHEKFGVTDTSALRVTFSGGVGQPLLDVLIGMGDAMGQNVYMRKQGQNEIRSGEDKFSAYIFAGLPSWYNLRLVPETEDGKLDVNNVQRLSVYQGTSTPKVFTRKGREWTLNGMSVAKPDMSAIDAYVRGVLYVEGDDFVANAAQATAPQAFDDSRIELQLGTGKVVTINLSAPDEEDRRMAITSADGLVYSLPAWTAGRLFRDDATFERQD